MHFVSVQRYVQAGISSLGVVRQDADVANVGFRFGVAIEDQSGEAARRAEFDFGPVAPGDAGRAPRGATAEGATPRHQGAGRGPRAGRGLGLCAVRPRWQAAGIAAREELAYFSEVRQNGIAAAPHTGVSTPPPPVAAIATDGTRHLPSTREVPTLPLYHKSETVQVLFLQPSFLVSCLAIVHTCRCA